MSSFSIQWLCRPQTLTLRSKHLNTQCAPNRPNSPFSFHSNMLTLHWRLIWIWVDLKSRPCFYLLTSRLLDEPFRLTFFFYIKNTTEKPDLFIKKHRRLSRPKPRPRPPVSTGLKPQLAELLAAELSGGTAIDIFCPAARRIIVPGLPPVLRLNGERRSRKTGGQKSWKIFGWKWKMEKNSRNLPNNAMKMLSFLFWDWL